MKEIIVGILVVTVLSACGLDHPDKPSGIQISLNAERHAEIEAKTRAQLLALHSKHDLEKWIFTREVIIKSGSVPRSHPVLTLNTRYNDDENKLLATYLHEQFHWFSLQNEKAVNLAIDDLRAAFPNAPISRPEAAKTLESSYLHLIICMLEYDAMRQLLGEEAAMSLIDSKTYYTWIYEQVLKNEKAIKSIMDIDGVRLPQD